MLGARLPSRSETFVYRELFALRDAGLDVRPASVRAPARGLGEPRLETLAEGARVVYGSRATLGGVWWIGIMVAGFWPRAWATLWRAHRDAWGDASLSLKDRVKCFVQAVGAVSLAWRCRRDGLTHIHAHMAHVPTTVAMYAAHALRLPFSFTGHAVDLFRDGRLLAVKARRAHWIAAISRWHVGWYTRELGVDPAKVHVIRCGVDVPAGDTLEEAEPVVLCVARLVPKKGVDRLIRAFDAVAGRHPAWRLEVVGDGPEREALEALVTGCAASSRIHLMGALPHREVIARIRRCGVFALAARQADDGDRDGIPVVLMEAMAAGRLVISGAGPAIGELVEPGVTGILVDEVPGTDEKEVVGRLAGALEHAMGGVDGALTVGAGGAPAGAAGDQIVTSDGDPGDSLNMGITMPAAGAGTAPTAPEVSAIRHRARARVAREFSSDRNAARWIRAFQEGRRTESARTP